MRHALLIALGLIMLGVPWSADSASGQVDATASPAPVLILGAQEPKPDTILATRKIVDEQTLLGSGDTRFTVVHGSISIGTPVVWRLSVPESKKPMPVGEEEASQFFLIEFPFTLEPPKPERRYSKATFKVQLSEPNARVYKLMPELVVSEQDEEQEFDVGFIISIPGPTAGSSLGDVGARATQVVRFTRLIPRTTAYGIGTGFFRWEFTGQDDKMLVIPGARTTAAVIQVPKGIKQLDADIGWDVEVQRTRFEKWFNVPAKVEGLQLNIPLL